MLRIPNDFGKKNGKNKWADTTGAKKIRPKTALS